MGRGAGTRRAAGPQASPLARLAANEALGTRTTPTRLIRPLALPEEWGGETYHQGLAAQGYKPLDGRWYSPEEYPGALVERRVRLLAEARAAVETSQRPRQEV